MAKGISIGIASDTREFASGVKKGIIDPLEDASDALDDVARDGSKAGDKLERAFKDAQGEVSDFKKEQSELARAMQKASKKGSDDWADNSKRGFGKAQQAADEFKAEATANFAETASSFDGSMDSIADMAQGTLGGLAGAIPGAGIALAGLGAAAGAFYAQWQENAEKTEERISAMYDDMLESGLDYLSQDYVNEQLAALREDQGKYNDLVQLSKDLGLELSDVLIAQVTKGEERDRVEAAVAERYREQLRLAGEIEDGMTHTGNEAANVAGKFGKWREHFEALNEEQDGTLSTVKEIRDAQAQVNAKYTEEGKLIDANNKKLATAPKIERPVVPAPDTSRLDAAIKRHRAMTVEVRYVDRQGRRID